jgi:hypothetical protein
METEKIVYIADLTIYDLAIGTLLFILILVYGNSKTNKNKDIQNKGHYKYFMPNIYFKMFLAFLFASVYQFYYQGGDTMAYFKGAQNLHNLFWESPLEYWDELMATPDYDYVSLRFNANTGFPPHWIYRDPNSFFVSKILSVMMIFVGQSYVALTMILSFLSSIASWKVFELVKSYKITSDRFAALSVLFIPSVSFWCAGISKDTMVLISVFFVVYFGFGLANNIIKKKLLAVLWIFAFSSVLYHTRTFMLFTVLASIALGLSVRITRSFKDSLIIVYILRFFIISVGFGAFFLFLQSQSKFIEEVAGQYLTEATVQQQDFATNKTYGEKRYYLGNIDPTPVGMMRVAPQAILTAFYRPGIWEANSPLLLVSGLETSLFIILTALFLFRGSPLKKIRIIRSNEFLIFGFLFAVILAFFAGFTSGLFGVLVRFKAPLLPFLLLVFTTQAKSNSEEIKLDKSTF